MSIDRLGTTSQVSCNSKLEWICSTQGHVRSARPCGGRAQTLAVCATKPVPGLRDRQVCRGPTDEHGLMLDLNTIGWVDPEPAK